MRAPFNIVMFLVSLSVGMTTGRGTGAMGLGIESLQTTFVSDTREFMTGPGVGFIKLSLP